MTCALFVLAAPALAWEHSRDVWVSEDMPVQVRVADDGAPNSPEACEASGGWSGCCDADVPAGSCYAATRDAFDYWQDVDCVHLDVDVLDGTSDPSLVANNLTSRLGDGLNTVVFDDPLDIVAETGTLGVTFSRRLEVAWVFDGVTYYAIEEADIVLNDRVDLITREQAVDEGCYEGFSLDDLMIHEAGHFVGMDHSCDDPGRGGAPCTDPVLRSAVMYWSLSPCDAPGGHFGVAVEDDQRGIQALYGPTAEFTCSHRVSDDLSVGVVPFELKCAIVSSHLGDITTARWRFGDGPIVEGMSASHTYTEQGDYTVELIVEGVSDTCTDGWSWTHTRAELVRACDVPDARFVLEHVDGFAYQVLNESDVSVYGCISDIQWDVFRGPEAVGEPVLAGMKSWDPLIELPGPGTWTVVMSLGGIAGTGGAKATVEVVEERALACETGAGGWNPDLVSLFGRRRIPRGRTPH